MSEEKINQCWIRDYKKKRDGHGFTYTVHKLNPKSRMDYEPVIIFTPSELAAHDEKIAREAFDDARKHPNWCDAVIIEKYVNEGDCNSAGTYWRAKKINYEHETFEDWRKKRVNK